MKKFYQYLLYSVILLSLILACSKELDDDAVVSFDITVNQLSQETPLNIGVISAFNISSVSTINEGDFQIRYEIAEGEGMYFLDGTAIPENQFVDLPSGSGFSIEYIGTTVGNHVVNVVVRETASNVEKEVTIRYAIIDTDFVFNITQSRETSYVEGIVDLNINIQETSEASYTIQYVFVSSGDAEQGSGRISEEGLPLNPEADIEIPVGDTVWQFEGLELGTVIIEFTVTSSLGIPRTEIIEIAIGEVPDFIFSGALENDGVFFTTNSAAIINFNLQEVAAASNYVMNYTTSNTGNIVYNGEIFEPGTDIPILIGESIGTYIGTVEGAHELSLTVSNDNSTVITREQLLTINFRDPDGEAPVIELIGDSELTISAGNPFMDLGAMAIDDVDGDISTDIVVSGEVNIAVPGTYTLIYSITDSSDNTASVQRTVIVVDDIAPVITIAGDNPLQWLEGISFVNPTATASDNVDGNVSSQIEVTGTVDVNVVGEYQLTYTVNDEAGNEASEVLTVNVISDAPPVLLLLGDNPLEVSIGDDTFEDPGATASDVVDGDISGDIIVTGSVDVNTIDSYTLTYTVTDSSNNTVSITRTVNVIDDIRPIIMLIGDNPQTITVEDVYIEQGATANDNVDGDISENIIISGTVNANVVGEYTISYNVQDAAGNDAVGVDRTVIVEEEAAIVSFDISTGILTAPAGASVSVTMNSGGAGSGNANISVNSGNVRLGTGFTCFNPTQGSQCLSNDDDNDDNDATSSFIFVMPLDGTANFVGSHTASDANSSTSFTISVAGESFSGSMSVGSGIPQ